MGQYFFAHYKYSPSNKYRVFQFPKTNIDLRPSCLKELDRFPYQGLETPNNYLSQFPSDHPN